MLINENKLKNLIKSAILKELNEVDASNRFKSVLPGSDRKEKDLDFLSGNVEIREGIKWGPSPGNEKRIFAFQALSYFLPNGTKLTSCYRDQNDQNRIIKNYADKKGYSGDKNDYDKMHKFIKDKGLVVARKIGTGHGGLKDTGAFDLSGVGLNKIWSGVEKANKELVGKVKFAGLRLGKGKESIIERENNAVHVHFNLFDVKLTKKDLEELKNKYGQEKKKNIPKNKPKNNSNSNSNPSPGLSAAAHVNDME